MSRLDDILKMPAEKRRKLNLSRKKRTYKRHPRRMVSHDDLIQYLRTNEMRTSRELGEKRQEGDPNLYDYRKEFGSWNQAKLVAFGPPPPSIGRFDAKYMASAVIEFNLWSREAYHSKRMLRPDILPSLYFVYKEWGMFGNLTQCAKEVSLRRTLDTYLSFWRRLGRTPTLAECEAENVNLETPIKHFGNKKEMDKFLSTLEI